MQLDSRCRHAPCYDVRDPLYLCHPATSDKRSRRTFKVGPAIPCRAGAHCCWSPASAAVRKRWRLRVFLTAGSGEPRRLHLPPRELSMFRSDAPARQGVLCGRRLRLCARDCVPANVRWRSCACDCSHAIVCLRLYARDCESAIVYSRLSARLELEHKPAMVSRSLHLQAPKKAPATLLTSMFPPLRSRVIWTRRLV